MYVVKKEKVDNIDFNNYFFLSFSKKRYDYFLSQIKNVDTKAFNYFCAIHREASIKNAAYMTLIKENIEKASTVIIFLDDESLENIGANNMVAYEIGLVRGLNKRLLLVNDNLSKEAFNKFNESPYRQNQLIDIGEIQEFVNKKSNLSKNIFSNDDVNKVAYPRINFVRMVVYMDLKKAFIDALKDVFNEEDNEKILEILEQNLNVGIKVIRFGHYNDDKTPFFWPYVQEKEEINKYFPFADGESINVIASDFSNAHDSTDKVATVRMEFVFPIHTILGVNFLLFFKIKGNMILDNDVINMLVSDGLSEDEISIKDNYIYFPINVKELAYKEENDNKIICNFMYPS